MKKRKIKTKEKTAKKETEKPAGMHTCTRCKKEFEIEKAEIEGQEKVCPYCLTPLNWKS